MTTVTTPSLTFLEWTVGDLSIPCDFAGEPECPDEPAAWILHRIPCCERKNNVALACDSCKEHRLMDQFSLECEFCGHIFEHAPDAYHYIESLNRKS